MSIRKVVLASAILSTAAHAQYGMESMMNPMSMMNPGMMMNPMTMMMPMTMMGGMGNPMAMMMPMTMMSAPMMGGMMNPMSMMAPMGGFGGPSPQQTLANPYLNPMGVANPYVAQQPVPAAPGFFPMMPSPQPAAPAYGMPFGMPAAAPAPVYGMPAAPAYGVPAAPAYGAPVYGYYPQAVAPQPAPAGSWDPSAWMQMYSVPAQPMQPAPQR